MLGGWESTKRFWYEPDMYCGAGASDVHFGHNFIFCYGWDKKIKKIRKIKEFDSFDYLVVLHLIYRVSHKKVHFRNIVFLG